MKDINVQKKKGAMGWIMFVVTPLLIALAAYVVFVAVASLYTWRKKGGTRDQGAGYFETAKSMFTSPRATLKMQGECGCLKSQGGSPETNVVNLR